jgi:UDP-N-acetylmuramate dehydrogenase
MGLLLENESLVHYNTWRVGGVAKRLFRPDSITDLQNFLKSLPLDEAVYWLGLGSNCLIRDGGIDGTVIITQGAFKDIKLLDEQHVRVEAGVSCASMARFCARNNLADAEFWAGIPGTMGGALKMNAGCHQHETWDTVKNVETMDRFGNIRTRDNKEYTVQYRQVDGHETEWFLAGTFYLQKVNKEKSLSIFKQLLEKRANTQPTSEYNCGSVFRNPPQNYAAKLIESCGLKGFTLGGAQVSTKHANFIINQDGKATANDIENLIMIIKDKVLQQHGIKLIQEVHFLGEYTHK